MAIIGRIKEVKTVDDQTIVIVETGSGPAFTATVMAGAGAEFRPHVGDSALMHRAGQENIVSAIIGADSKVANGESLIFSRDADGNVVATILLDADGKVTITPKTTTEVGNGSDFVSMATKVDLLWATLDAMFRAWEPVPTDGGTALQVAYLAAFPVPPTSTASANLKAD